MNNYKKTVITRYEGGNDALDRLLAFFPDDEPLWMVNGPYGRRPVNASTEEEARTNYFEQYDKDSRFLV